MHELSISRSVVDMCVERAMGAQVKRVTLVVGQLSAVLPDSLRFCFDICAEGTPVEGALLEIIEVPGLAVCRDCGDDVALTQPFGRCACGSVDLQFVAGEELNVKEMEVA